MAVGGDPLQEHDKIYKEQHMPKEEWGTKRLCPETGSGNGQDPHDGR